jgi:hypothetical protein
VYLSRVSSRRCTSGLADLAASGCLQAAQSPQMRATLLAEQDWIVRPLRAYGTCTAVMSKGVLEVTVCRTRPR